MRSWDGHQNSLSWLAALCGLLLLSVLSIQPASAKDSVKCLGGLTCLDQGWNNFERNYWYRTSQGSRLLPLDWMLALELPDTDTKFISDGHMTELGYLPAPKSAANPFGLPVGFTVDLNDSDDANIMCDTFEAACRNGTMRRRWIGMNCSACHTNDIQIGDVKLRVEGAPTLADFQGLEEQLLNSLKAAMPDAADPAKFDRFAKAVLGKKNGPGPQAELAAQIKEQIVWQEKLQVKNAAPVRYGHGRLDAQGHILNKVALTTRPQNLTSDEVMADAPASYPFVWNTSQQSKIQWNGIATNKARIPFLGLQTDVGALIRNTSEVIGVFGHLVTDGRKAWRGYRSSARVKELIGLERRLATLQSPQWPEDLLGPLDPAKVARGRALFAEKKCSNCHDHIDADDVRSTMNESMDPINDQGTDIFLACNTYLHKSDAGSFEGQKMFGVAGAPLPANGPTRNMLVNATVGTILGKKGELFEAIFTDVAANPEPVSGTKEIGVTYLPGVSNAKKAGHAKTCLTDGILMAADPDDPDKPNPDNILAYKARSLNGIWATAPYLHNGSVPTLYDMLLTTDLRLKSPDAKHPAPGPGEAKRPDVFRVGSRRLDPVKVGFVTDASDPANSFEFRVKDATTDEPIPGNYNSGHDYGTSTLSEADKMSLVEYLKSL